MSLQSKRELEVSREKLRGLEELYVKTKGSPADDSYARDLTMRPLQHTIDELKEEIARFEARSARPAK